MTRLGNERLASSDRLWWDAAREPLDLTMTDKRRALSALTKPELLELARAFDLPVGPRTPVDEPGRYSVAAKVTDVFGNDGVSVIEVNVK